MSSFITINIEICMKFYSYVLIGLILFTSNLKSQPAPDYSVLKCGYSKSLTVQMKMEEGKAVVEVLIQEIIKENSRSEKAESIIIENSQQLLQEIKNGLDMTVVLVPEYWELKKKIKLFPQVIPVTGDSVQDRTLLLIKKNSSIKNLNDLAGKKIVISGEISTEKSIMQIWLHTLIKKQTQKEVHKFFGSVYKVSTGPTAIMDLFFNKADAALVIQSNYLALQELNPQIGEQLKVFIRSEPFVFAVLLFTEKLLNHPDKKLIMDKILNIDKTRSGKNYLNLFKLTKMVPYQEAYLENTFRLLSEYEKFKK